MITGPCLVILHLPGTAYRLCLHPVLVCLHHHGTSLFPKLQADDVFSVFYPKSDVCDPGNMPSQTWAELPAPSLASVQQPAPARLNKLPVELGRGKGVKPLGSQLPLQRLLGHPWGSGAHSCIKELVPKPAFPNRDVSAPAMFLRRKRCF